MKTLTAVLSVLLMAAAAQSDSAKPRERSMFAQFIGVNQGRPDKQPIWKYITFTRSDLSWDRVQPKGPDSWDDEYLKKWGETVLRNRKRGVETLPLLAYMVPWAARRRACNAGGDDLRCYKHVSVYFGVAFCLH